MNNEQINLLWKTTKEQVEMINAHDERDYDEFTRMTNEMLNLQRELVQKNNELEKLNNELKSISVTDSLTGLYNRRGFFELGVREVERAKRFGRSISVIMLDIDQFKEINDAHGHEAGDQVLQKLAERCRNNLRRVDVLGRYGGDEFSVLLPETSFEGACFVAERLRYQVAKEPFETSHWLFSIKISLGVKVQTDKSMTLEELLKHADEALYQAKESGRNRVCVYDDQLQA